MGQAMVDLPDPLDTPAPDTLAGTDDLLAQIAGDEIDRLIAESEDGRGPSAPRGGQAAARRDVTPALSADSAASVLTAGPVPAAASVAAAQQNISAAAPAPPVMPVDGAEDADGTTPAGDEDADDTTEVVATVSPAALEADAELDKLLEEMSQAERSVAPPEPAPAATSAAAPPASAASAPTQPAPDAELLMSSEEREALKLAAIDAETDAAEADDAAAAAAQAESGPPPLPVAVLEMINAPLAFIPDGLRDILGKVAILTLVNSLAVLLYVLFIRR